MSGRPYDSWGDVDGVHIPDWCRVEQIAVAARYGARPSRLHKQGLVVGRGHNRLHVRFDGDGKVTSVRPHLVRVLDTRDGAR